MRCAVRVVDQLAGVVALVDERADPRLVRLLSVSSSKSLDLVQREARNLGQHLGGANTNPVDGVCDAFGVGVLDLVEQDAVHRGLVGPHARFS